MAFIPFPCSAQEHADAAGRKTLNPQDIVLATTEHLSGIGGDANGATELRDVLEDELEGNVLSLVGLERGY